MIDRYTKAVLTLIALSLAALAIEQAAPPAYAQPQGCGAETNPCYVATSTLYPFEAQIDR